MISCEKNEVDYGNYGPKKKLSTKAQTWNKRLALHHPGIFFYTTTFQNFKFGYVKLKIIARLKKGREAFPKQSWVRKI